VKLKQIVAQNLRHYRKKANLTQEALGWKAKLHPNYLGRVERGEDTISMDNIEKVAKVLKIAPHLLLIPESYKGE
jgi:transcriptional regulator with XRE-family HTH domain